jgi:hypothetical protein
MGSGRRVGHRLSFSQQAPGRKNVLGVRRTLARCSRSGSVIRLGAVLDEPRAHTWDHATTVTRFRRDIDHDQERPIEEHSPTRQSPGGHPAMPTADEPDTSKYVAFQYIGTDPNYQQTLSPHRVCRHDP